MKKIKLVIVFLSACGMQGSSLFAQSAPVPPATIEESSPEPTRTQQPGQGQQAKPAEQNYVPPVSPAAGSRNVNTINKRTAPLQSVPTQGSSQAQPPRPTGNVGGISPPANQNGSTTPSSPPNDPISGPSSTDSEVDIGVKIDIPEKKGAEAVPPGQELVSIHFPEPTEIKDIIKAVSIWTGKNVILGDQGIKGKVQIISPRSVTKEEAYQAFLSALNLLKLTTVETGKVVKIMPIMDAVKGNLKTFMGSDWTPRTDEVITQIVPLKYIDAKAIQNTLRSMVNPRTGQMIAYEPTNTLIISDSGYRIRSILDVIKLIDVQGQQPQVSIVPIRYADAKDVADKVNEILKSGGGKGAVARPGGSSSGFMSYKIIVDERSNSVAVFGPPRTIQDVKDLVKKFDIKLDDPSHQSSIHVRPLDYASATKLAATLSALANGGATGAANNQNRFRRFSPPNAPGGPGASNVNAAPSVAKLDDNVKITADESSNSLLITGSRAAYQSLNTIIRKLDVRRSQVFVESDILDVSLSDNFKFGTSVFAGYTNDKYNGPIAWQAGGGIGEVALATSATAIKDGNGVANALTSIVNAFKEDLTVGILSSKSIDIPGLGPVTPGALIKLIKSDGNTKQLASPQILTANNEEANITVGESKYFKVNSEPSPTTGLSTTSTRKVDANLSLTVKPNISHSNYVTLDIKIEADSLGNVGVGELPSVNTRKSNQIVTVKNKQTIVVSGLIKNGEIEDYNKIPLLGDIPVLGWLFRNTTQSKIRSNLMMFLTPYIVHGADDLADIYKSKREEADEFFYKVYGRSFKKTPFYSTIPNYQDGRYVEDPIDRMEQERRNQMLKEMYDASAAEDTPNVGHNYPIDSSPTTVPAGVMGGDGGGGNGGSDYQPIEPRDIPEPPEQNEPSEPMDIGGGDE